MTATLHPRPAQSGNLSSGVVRHGCALALFERFFPQRGARILDVGCGNGFFLRALREKGYADINGLEANDYGLSLSGYEVRFADISYEALPWEDMHFDGVSAWEVMEHLENPYAAIREISRILKPQGLWILSMPNVFHIENRLLFFRRGDFWRWNEQNDHRNIFTHALFKKAFLSHFSLIGTYYCPSTLGKRGLLGKIRKKLRFLDRWLPENELFGGFVIYVLQKNKPAINPHALI